MTVEDLISELKTFPKDLEIFTRTGHGFITGDISLYEETNIEDDWEQIHDKGVMIEG